MALYAVRGLVLSKVKDRIYFDKYMYMYNNIIGNPSYGIIIYYVPVNTKAS